jgi:hypothetical protein
LSAAGDALVGSASKLLPHQASFVASCIDPSSARIVVLRAPVGVGKSDALVALMADWLRNRRSARVLLLTPSLMLRSQYLSMLRDEKVSAVLVDRYQFRQALDSPRAQDLWPQGIVSVSSLDFAKQPDVLTSLARVHWDLLIVDEAHLLRGTRADAVRLLSRTTTRVVLATHLSTDLSSGGDAIASIVSGELRTIEWRRDRLGDVGTPPNLLPRMVVHHVEYARSESEASIFTSLELLAHDWHADEPYRTRVVGVLVRSFESSPVALEQSLLQLVEGVVATDYSEDASPPTEEASVAAVPEEGELRNSERLARSLAMPILQAVEAMVSDSKLTALKGLLTQLSGSGSSERHVCVLTEYVSTLYYLAAAIEETGVACQVLHGEMSDEARRDALSSFLEGHGVLAATTAALQGFEALGTTDLVLYDVPMSEIAVHIALSRFYRLGRKSALDVHLFSPSYIAGLRERLRITLDELLDLADGSAAGETVLPQ